MIRKAPSIAFVSVAELARQHGMDPRTAQGILDRAGLKRSPRGYDAAVAATAVLLFDETPERAGHASQGRGGLAQTEEAKRALVTKERLDQARSRKIEIDNEVREGQLVERAQVVREGSHLVATARERFLALGKAVAHRLVDQSDALLIARTIEGEARIILNDLSAILSLGERVAT